MHDIKSLGNQQLGLHYEVTHKKLNDIQLAIVDDIADLLGKMPAIDYTIYTNAESFHTYCQKYRTSIQQEKKELFITLMQQQKNIKKEIKARQIRMIKEIGITIPSVRVQMIMEITNGTNFQSFDEMITYIKLARVGKTDERPKNKKIYVPSKLIKTFESLGTTLLTILAKNEGPTTN